MIAVQKRKIYLILPCNQITVNRPVC